MSGPGRRFSIAALASAAAVVGLVGCAAENDRGAADQQTRSASFTLKLDKLDADAASAAVMTLLGLGQASTRSSFPAAGDAVTVHFRRDALGLAGTTPAGLDYGGPQRDTLKVSGTYVGGTPGWVTLDTDDGRRLSIPVAQVLAVETAAPPKTRP